MLIANFEGLNKSASLKLEDIKYYNEYLFSISNDNFIVNKLELLEVLGNYAYSIKQLKELVLQSIDNDNYEI